MSCIPACSHGWGQSGSCGQRCKAVLGLYGLLCPAHANRLLISNNFIPDECGGCRAGQFMPLCRQAGDIGWKNAVRCMGLCTALHRSSQRAAFAFAPHCVRLLILVEWKWRSPLSWLPAWKTERPGAPACIVLPAWTPGRSLPCGLVHPSMRSGGCGCAALVPLLHLPHLIDGVSVVKPY